MAVRSPGSHSRAFIAIDESLRFRNVESVRCRDLKHVCLGIPKFPYAAANSGFGCGALGLGVLFGFSDSGW